MSVFLPARSTCAPFTQDSVVDAAIALLAKLDGLAAGSVERPDKRNRCTPDVDALVTIGAQPYALEHTGVEQFGKALALSASLRRHEHEVRMFRDRLDQGMPAGTYDVQMLSGLEAPHRLVPSLLRAAEAELVRTASALTPPGNVYSNIATVRVAVDQHEARFRLVRGFDTLDGTRSIQVRYLHKFSGGEAGDRIAVLDRLLVTKMMKLALYGATHRTALVLEDRAFIATPFPLLFLAADRLRRANITVPDLVVVVDCEPDVWSLQYVRRDEPLSRELFKTNWWVMDPADGLLVQKDWDHGCREALHHAREDRRGR